MDAIIEKLNEWGCDTDSAIKRISGDEDFYVEILQEIPGDQYFQLLGEALKKQDIEQAFEAAHTLKGVLANVGLTPMLNKIVEIVEPLRQGQCDNLLSKYAELMQMKEKLTDILN